MKQLVYSIKNLPFFVLRPSFAYERHLQNYSKLKKKTNRYTFLFLNMKLLLGNLAQLN